MAVVFAVLAFSLIAASAATLGGVNASGVGADEGLAASCDTNGVNVDFTLTNVGGTVQVTDVVVSGIHGNCDGEAVYVTLLDGPSGNSLGTAGPAIAGDNGTNNNSVTVSGFNADPYAVNAVYVVIG
jgi:hypothetical protein